MIELELVFEFRALSALEMWTALVDTRHAAFPNDLIYNVDGKPRAFHKVAYALLHHDPSYFNIESKVGCIKFSGLKSVNFSFLKLRRGFVDSDTTAIEWMEQLVKVPGFIHGRAYDRNYDYWQNVLDPDMHQRAGRTMDGLKTKSNGKPFPVEMTIVDTSDNPGRRINRIGFIEAIGHLTWFSDEFWKRTGLQRNIPSWVMESRRVHNVDFVRFSSEPFVEGDNSEELQRRVRRAFFPQ